MDEFSKLREQWYSACVKGNTTALKSFESEDLKVIVNGQVDTDDRYDAIDLKVQATRIVLPRQLRMSMI